MTQPTAPARRPAAVPLPRSLPLHLLHRIAVPVVAAGQAVVMAALPSGGQRAARRNAWAGMSADSSRSRSRREGEAALAASQRRADTRTALAAARTS